METKEIKIEIPVGYEIDKEKTTFEKIVFKKIENTKPRSWNEYCKQRNNITVIKNYYFIDNGGNVRVIGWRPDMPSDSFRNTLPTKELAEAFRAMMQLMSLRQAWIGDWKPFGSNDNLVGFYCIDVYLQQISIDFRTHTQSPLSFPTKEMAEDFMGCFKDLLEIAKPLI